MLKIFNQTKLMTLTPHNPTWDQLSDYAKKVMANGCGAKGGFLAVPSFVFKSACNEHDFYYWLGGGAQDRRAADRRFLTHMIEKAVGGDWFVRPIHVFLSLMYYSAVRWHGGKFFHYRESFATWEDLLTDFPHLKNHTVIPEIVD